MKPGQGWLLRPHARQGGQASRRCTLLTAAWPTRHSPGRWVRVLTLSEVGLGERCAGSGLGQGHQETRRALGGGWGKGHRLSGSHAWHPWVLEVDCLCRVSVASWVTGLFTRDGWSRASRTVRRHSLTQPAVPPPPPPPRGCSLGLGPCLGNVGASAAGAVCSARGAGRGGSEDHGLRTARPSGAQFAASRPSGQHVATEVEATCAFRSDSPPSRSRLPRGGRAPSFWPRSPQGGRGRAQNRPAAP